MTMSADQAVLLARARELCRQNGAELVFLTLFGADLYGTRRSDKSDLDVRGLFLPETSALVLGPVPKSLHFSTGGNDRRNQVEDVDIDLWSVGHWLKLLAAGDIGALDLIFAPSNAEAVIWQDSRLDVFFGAPLELLDTVESRAYAEYSLSQAKKYGIKGSRLGAVKAVQRWLEDRPTAPDERLEPHLDALAALCDDERFCRRETIRDRPGLNLGGKLFSGRMKLAEFAARVETEMERYGERAREAEANQGLDFKALSHAVRALDQMLEIFETGRVRFPLRNRAELLAIKEGRYAWPELEPLILERLRLVDERRQNARHQGRHNADFARQALLSCYGLRPPPAIVESEAAGGPPDEAGFAIPEAARRAIAQRLAAVEAEHGVRILYACESGSRGWGFASPDSDYDVRFVYVRPRDWYLRLTEPRDVIEPGLEETGDGLFDLSGWDLRKALRLFQNGHSTLLEWLSSPLAYRDAGRLRERLRDLAPRALSPVKSWHNYQSMMRQRLKATAPGGRSIKDWFYIIRPLLAMRWLEQDRGPAPMRFDHLVNATVDDPAVRDDLRRLVRLKSRARERADLSPPASVVVLVQEELARLEAAPPAWDRRERLRPGELDELFLAILRENESP